MDMGESLLVRVRVGPGVQQYGPGGQWYGLAVDMGESLLVFMLKSVVWKCWMCGSSRCQRFGGFKV